jgi:5-formyltetrahydrofolate cyclo-ligase
MTIAALKDSLRKEALERRLALKGSVAELSARIAENFLARIPIPSGAIVSAYVAIGDEADPFPLIQGLRARGHRIALPRVVGRGKPLDFHLYEPGAKLVPGGFGLSEPSRDWPILDPDVLAVPLLAFDAQGYRIGYGAGFYDRTLSRLRAARHVLAAGYCFSIQEVAAVPHDEKDEPLDWSVTETGAHRFER